MILGFPEEKEIKVQDYNVMTGKYKYTRYMAMDIINKDGLRGLFNILVWNKQRKSLRPFKA